MKSQIYDLAIVGAGPAGSFAAKNSRGPGGAWPFSMEDRKASKGMRRRRDLKGIEGMAAIAGGGGTPCGSG